VAILRVRDLTADQIGSQFHRLREIFFVNALNEWGDGNVLEPSKQFGDGYGKAMKNAIEMSEKMYIWADKYMEQGLALFSQETHTNKNVDICVLIRALPEHHGGTVYNLPTALRFLQAQNNPNWRAMVYQTKDKEFDGIRNLIFSTFDPGIELLDRFKIPTNDSSGADYQITDWVIKQLNESKPCASANISWLQMVMYTMSAPHSTWHLQARATL